MTSFKTSSQLAALVAVLFSVAASPAHATAYLFTTGGAGSVGITVGHGAGSAVLTLALSGAVNMANNTQVGIALSTGDKLTMTGGLIAGQVDFADPVSTTASHFCTADTGGNCVLATGSTVTAGTITGLTQQAAAVVNNAITDWTNDTSGWTGVAGTNVDLSAGGTICAGTGTGCTLGIGATPTNKLVNGAMQTAYVYNITSTTIGGTITIKGDGSALIILQYTNATKLTTTANSKVTLTGGVSSDQVLLNDTSNGGIDTSAGFNYTGAVAINSAVAGATMNLNSALIAGRLFLNDSATPSSSVLLGSGFALTATPEPSTMLLIGGALIGIAVLSRKVQR